MMVEALFNELVELNVHVSLQGDDISLKGLKKEYAPVLIPKIKAHKSELITYLKSLDTSGSKEYTAIPKVETKESYVLSPSQYRLWVLSQFEESSIAYNIPISKVLHGVYHIPTLEKAIMAVARRHEILRTVFRENSEGKIRQWILPTDALNFKIAYKDYRNERNQDSLVNAYMNEDGVQPFDLVNGPLLRVSMLQMEDQKSILYFNIHHIISDGWSIEVLSKEVFTFYHAFIKDTSPKLDQLSIQYKDYSAWQQTVLRSEDQQLHKSFWLKQLEGSIPALNLPSERKRPLIMTYSGRNLGMTISKEDAHRLKTYCRNQKASLFMGILSIWKILLSKYSSQSDILIGTPVAGRNHIELENQIGFYVNTILLRNQVDQTLTFDTLFQEIVRNTLNCYQHQDYPFDSIVSDLNLEKDTSRNPLFDVMITFSNVENVNEDSVDSIDVHTIQDYGACMAKFDLDITVQEVSGHLHVSLIFNTDVYQNDMMVSLLNNYKNLLHNILFDTQKALHEILYLSKEDTEELVYEFNAFERTKYPTNITILDLFRKQVQERPNNFAVSYDSKSLTFQELDALTNQLTNYIESDHKFQVEDFIGIKLKRSEWVIVSIFTVLKLGAAYIPIDPEYPEDRIKYIEEDSDCKLMIDDEFIQRFNESKDQYSTHYSSPLISPSNLAYAIYTSGSTGQPKGVLVEHQSVVNIHWGWCEAYGLDTFEVNLLQFANFSFDMSVADISRSILNGGHMVICGNEMKFDQEGLYHLIQKFQISIFESPPALVMPLIEYLQEQNLSINSLKLLVLGGEKVTYEKFDFLVNHFGQKVRLINSYGVTEATVDTTYYEFDQQMNINEDVSMPIGIPFHNNCVYVLDPFNKLVPKGVMGELCIGGFGVTRGYLNNEELTASKFVSNPFAPEEKIYKTGDLARWLSDGNLEYIGREDDQIKLRGFRVELGEIEKKLLSITGIKEAVVRVLRSEEIDNDQLVAYIVAEEIQSASKLNNQLTAMLPPYMLPNSYFQLEKIPLTPNGKIDKKALGNHDTHQELKSEYLAPRTSEEKALAEVWGTILKKESVGLQDNFYSLGGDSIKSIQVISLLKRNGYLLKIDLLLRVPVLEDLAKHVKQSKGPQKSFEVKGSIGLAPIQQAFVQDTNIKVPSYYNQSIVLKFRDEIDTDQLKKSMELLINHHEGLRLRFDLEDNAWVQYIEEYDERDYPLQLFDLTKESDPTQKMQEIGEDIQDSFHIQKSPLFKMVVFKLPEGDRLAMISHHLIMDGISWRIIMGDLGMLYMSEVPTSNAFEFKSDSYLSWVRCQQEYVNQGNLESERVIWEEIAACKASALPTDFSYDEQNIKINENISFSLNEEKTSLLKQEINGLHNTSIKDLLLIGLSNCLEQVFGIKEVMVLLEGHGREEIDENIDISRAIGWFTTNYPFVLKSSQTSNHLGSLLELKDKLNRIPNNGIGYGMLQYLSGEPLKMPETTIEFNYLGDFDQDVSSDNAVQQKPIFEFASESIGASTHEDNTSDILLIVSGMIVKNKLSVTLSYGNACFKKERMNEVLRSFEDHLNVIIDQLAQSKQKFSNIYALSPRQKWMYAEQFGEQQKSNFSQLTYRLTNLGLSRDKIYSAYSKLLEKHEILRTSFGEFSGTLYQKVHADAEYSFSFVTPASQLTRNEISDFVRQTKEKDLREPFDFKRPSLMRLTFIEMEEDTYELIWSFHHIILDGWSIGILTQEFMGLLLLDSRDIMGMNNDPLLYANFINWIETTDTQKSLTYWKTYLEGYQTTAEVPLSEETTSERAVVMNKEVLTLEKSLLKSIQEVCQAYNITQNIFMQGVWGYLLSTYNNTRDVVFGTLVSGRSDEVMGVDGMIGLLTNLIPVRLRFEAQDSPAQILKNLQESWANSLYHHHIDFSELESLNDFDGSLIDSVLTFQNFPMDDSSSLDQRVQKEPGAKGTVEVLSNDERSSFNFNIEVKPNQESMLIDFSYDQTKYNRNNVHMIMDDFYELIHFFIKHTNSPLT